MLYKYNIMQRSRQIFYQRCTYTIYAVEWQRDCIYLSSVHRQGIYRLWTVKFVQCTLYIHYTEYKFTLYSAMYTVEGRHLFV